MKDTDVTIKASTYRKLKERARVAEVRAECAEREAEHTRVWAREAFAEQSRLGARCTQLYEVAMAHGATAEELRP